MAAVGRQRVGIPNVGCVDVPCAGLFLGRGAVTRNVLHLPVRPDGSTISRRWLAEWWAKDLLSIFRGSRE